MSSAISRRSWVIGKSDAVNRMIHHAKTFSPGIAKSCTDSRDSVMDLPPLSSRASVEGETLKCFASWCTWENSFRDSAVEVCCTLASLSAAFWLLGRPMMGFRGTRGEIANFDFSFRHPLSYITDLLNCHFDEIPKFIRFLTLQFSSWSHFILEMIILEKYNE